MPLETLSCDIPKKYCWGDFCKGFIMKKIVRKALESGKHCEIENGSILIGQLVLSYASGF